MTLFSQSETEASGPVVYTVVFWTLALKSMFVCVEKCVCVLCLCACAERAFDSATRPTISDAWHETFLAVHAARCFKQMMSCFRSWLP